MKKYQKQKCMRLLSKQVEESLARKKETMKKGLSYYQVLEKETRE